MLDYATVSGSDILFSAADPIESQWYGVQDRACQIEYSVGFTGSSLDYEG